VDQVDRPGIQCCAMSATGMEMALSPGLIVKTRLNRSEYSFAFHCEIGKMAGRANAPNIGGSPASNTAPRTAIVIFPECRMGFVNHIGRRDIDRRISVA
jgi:hypothetical protein